MSDKTFEKARDYAFLLLKFRLRSENELALRLKNKKFPPEVIKKVVSFLKERDFLNDKEFARAWVASRAKKPFGARRLRQELGIKGVDKDIVEAELKLMAQDYPEGEIVPRLARIKFEKLHHIEPLQAKRRIYGYLLRRGFSVDAIRCALEGL